MLSKTVGENVSSRFEKQAAERFFKRVVRPDVIWRRLFLADYTRRSPSRRNVDMLTRAIENSARLRLTALLTALSRAPIPPRGRGRRVMSFVSDGEGTYSVLKRHSTTC